MPLLLSLGWLPFYELCGQCMHVMYNMFDPSKETIYILLLENMKVKGNAAINIED